MTEGCSLPPPGWWCSREAGHDGPCPAWPEEQDQHANWIVQLMFAIAGLIFAGGWVAGWLSRRAR